MSKQLPWLDAIHAVLQKSHEPLHYTEIAEAIIEQGLCKQVGATPASTVASYLSVSITNEGEKSPFVRVQRGTYALRTPSGHAELVASSAVARGQDLTIDEASALGPDDAEELGLIHSFGVGWRRSAVHWQTSPPKLLGRNAPASDAVNFCQQSGVYLLLDGARVVYAGQVGDNRLGPRLKEHTADRLNARWDRFSWFGIRRVEEDGSLAPIAVQLSTKNLIDTLEAILIQSFEPPLNRRAGSSDAIEYIQVEDPQIERAQKRRLLQELEQGIL